jgi:hypothetical protein
VSWCSRGLVTSRDGRARGLARGRMVWSAGRGGVGCPHMCARVSGSTTSHRPSPLRAWPPGRRTPSIPMHIGNMPTSLHLTTRLHGSMLVSSRSLGGAAASFGGPTIAGRCDGRMPGSCPGESWFDSSTRFQVSFAGNGTRLCHRHRALRGSWFDPTLTSL